MTKPIINVTVYSDLACPWCWIGHRRLSAAIKAVSGQAEVRPEWRAILLDASYQGPAKDIQEALSAKFGVPAEPMMARVRQAGAPDGAPFAGWKWRASTVPGHMLVAAARRQGKSTHEAEELLFRQAFEQGGDISDSTVLSAAAKQLGLGDSAEAVIGSAAAGWDPQLRSEVVRDDERAKRELRVTGVPFFVISSSGSKRYALSGAQPAEEFLDVFQRVLAEGGEG